MRSKYVPDKYHPGVGVGHGQTYIGGSRQLSQIGSFADRLDDPALRDTASRTAIQHSIELCAQSDKSRDLVFDGGQMVASERVDVVTRSLRPILQCEQCSHGFDFETQFACMPDKGETAYVCGTIAPAPALGAERRMQETNLLVVSDGGYLHARLASNLTDLQLCCHFSRDSACSSSN